MTDSWFGNNGPVKPLRVRMGARVHPVRVNATLYAQSEQEPGKAGRPYKCGKHLAREGFGIDCCDLDESKRKPLIAAFMRLAA